MLTQEELKRLLHYDPDTGLFTWLVARCHAIKIGDVAGTIRKGYIHISIGSRPYSAHRLAWLYMTGSWPPNLIDHKNTNKSDNRWGNIRSATYIVNLHNRWAANANNKSGLRGVTTRPAYGFQAVIHSYGKRHVLGNFKTAEEAHAAYLEAKGRFHPEAE